MTDKDARKTRDLCFICNSAPASCSLPVALRPTGISGRWSEGDFTWRYSQCPNIYLFPLAAIGMEGVGQVFDAYRDGRLEDDDEVAVRGRAAGAGAVGRPPPLTGVLKA